MLADGGTLWVMTLVPAVPAAGQSQPWTRVIWPHERESAIGAGYASGPHVYDVPSALRLPAVARAQALYTGLIKQCPIDAYRGVTPLPRPRLLDRPDPESGRSWFVQVQVEDYLLHGNALQLVTRRNAEGWPASVAWLPAAWTSISWQPGKPTEYSVGGQRLPIEDVIHVRRGADRTNPRRGVGVIEGHLATLDRAGLEEDYERNNLSGAGVPSVAITVPNPGASEEELEDAFARWMDKFYGPVRQPAFLPAGTVVTPLGWSPEESQMVEARKMSLLDIANIYNLDGYWLGADASNLTYRSPGPMYLGLLRTSLEPVMADLEQGWSDAWLPYGQSVSFERLSLTRDDFATSVETLAKATESGLLSIPEARQYLGLAAPGGPALSVISPIDTEESEPEPIEEVEA